MPDASALTSSTTTFERQVSASACVANSTHASLLMVEKRLYTWDSRLTVTAGFEVMRLLPGPEIYLSLARNCHT